MMVHSPALNGIFVKPTFASVFFFFCFSSSSCFSQRIFHLPKEETKNVSFVKSLSGGCL